MKHNKIIFPFIYAYICTIALCTIILIGACLIPSHSLTYGVRSALDVIRSEGVYPSVGLPWRKITLDNYTDSLMINTAYTIDSRDPFASAMKGMRHISSASTANQIDHLQSSLKGQTNAQLVGYERYWHGYLTLLRPTLFLLSFSQLRILNMFCMYTMCMVLLYAVFKKFGLVVSLSFIAGFIATDFFTLFPSIQFSGVFYIGLLAALYLMRYTRSNRDIYLALFITGMFTSFFDLFTAPLVSLGVPLIIAYLMQRRRSPILISLTWGVGYAIMWISKWVLFEVTIGPGSLATAWAQIINRTITQADPQFSHIRAVMLNIMQLIGYDKTDRLILLILGFAGMLFFFRYRLRDHSLHRVLPLLTISTIPYVWYFMVANHSYLHVWFTYRAQYMTVVGLGIALTECIDWRKVQREWKIKRIQKLWGKPQTEQHNN